MINVAICCLLSWFGWYYEVKIFALLETLPRSVCQSRKKICYEINICRWFIEHLPSAFLNFRKTGVFWIRNRSGQQWKYPIKAYLLLNINLFHITTMNKKCLMHQDLFSYRYQIVQRYFWTVTNVQWIEAYYILDTKSSIINSKWNEMSPLFIPPYG